MDKQPSRAQRLWREARRAPLDWFFERSCAPNLLVFLAITLVAHVHPLPWAEVALAVNWGLPAAVNIIRAGIHRNWAYFTRPQAFQAAGHGHGHDGQHHHGPVELDTAARGVPRWMRRLTASAESGHWLAGQVDDWLAERSRMISFTQAVAMILIGPHLAVPWMATFAINAAVQNIPDVVGGYLAIRNRDADRAFRPGARQRASTLRRLGVEAHSLECGCDAPQQAPGLRGTDAAELPAVGGRAPFTAPATHRPTPAPPAANDVTL